MYDSIPPFQHSFISVRAIFPIDPYSSQSNMECLALGYITVLI